MPMIKRWRFCRFAFFVVLLAGAAARAEPPSAAQLLEGIARAPVLQGRYTQTKSIADLTRPLVTSGRFAYARGSC
jgi:hypothetical protein